MGFRGTLGLVVAGAALTISVLPATASAAGQAYYVKNANTSRCLDTNSTGSVYTHDCSGNTNQRWIIAGGKFTNVATKRCLASDGVSVAARPCADTAVQKWTSTADVKKYLEWNGSGRCLHNTGGPSEHAGMNPCGSLSSRWTFVQV
jgi:hypothetical protein